MGGKKRKRAAAQSAKNLWKDIHLFPTELWKKIIDLFFVLK